MTYTFAGDPEEYAAAGMIATRFHPVERKARRILLFVFPGGAAALWGVHQLLGDLGAITTVGNWLYPFVILWFPLFTVFLLPKVSRKQLHAAAASDPSLHGPIARSFDDDALVLQGADGSLGRIPWSSVTEVLDHPRFWIFMIPPRGFAYIPKRATDAQADERIRSWLARIGHGASAVS
jgi:hypothetical protein